jgi:hypothetical protein
MLRLPTPINRFPTRRRVARLLPSHPSFYVLPILACATGCSLNAEFTSKPDVTVFPNNDPSSPSTCSCWTEITGFGQWMATVSRDQAVEELRAVMRLRALEDACGVEISSIAMWAASESDTGKTDEFHRYTRSVVRGRILAEEIESLVWEDPQDPDKSFTAPRAFTLTLRICLDCNHTMDDSSHAYVTAAPVSHRFWTGASRDRHTEVLRR